MYTAETDISLFYEMFYRSLQNGRIDEHWRKPMEVRMARHGGASASPERRHLSWSSWRNVHLSSVRLLFLEEVAMMRVLVSFDFGFTGGTMVAAAVDVGYNGE
uniref:Uncharacterized protein n=1 Tax=Trieres chinensis TaxID=1514140 RepID=A0A7S2EYU4_TRICV|mmetsp:Transcript_9223/g.19562  ORF Transcript_9223/g.19562 Transcript_9223/m.19562 type:complete len:103 (+) Transcript_9223:293-601(+)|eukprot:CAMPEP_0183306968 /NCGR_PEP_ID=MMETSP0160_2-20130417/15324_1 /TAXON_ID=2839 ORGANISM="Odontella Sinensis, Strain Grunow 1884" /NCGR_SAMPLE_ID=MMETSP0160_2 /ASSEMBLY_ACC=CAM_ASM_000250 /LENGTH=102 /DNA_ID=CAMNT_0025470455 /DNA_START=293 /DNA_END=601 /DNA_ORIENTATION=+